MNKSFEDTTVNRSIEPFVFLPLAAYVQSGITRKFFLNFAEVFRTLGQMFVFQAVAGPPRIQKGMTSSTNPGF